MGIDLATWRARIGLNYYHMCRPLQTRWRSSSGLLYQPGVASRGVGEVMNDISLVLKGCMTVVALSLILQYVAHSWPKLKRRGRGGKAYCHWQGIISQVRGEGDGGGTLLLRAIVVVIPLLLVIAGDVETNPGPEELSLKALLNELHPVRTSWYKIGLQLNIPYTTLDCFKQNYSDQSDLMCETLKYWLKAVIDPPPTWEAVVTALRSPSVNEKYVAEQLELKYCTPVQLVKEKFHSPTKVEISEAEAHDQTTASSIKMYQKRQPHIGSESPTLSAARHSGSTSPSPNVRCKKSPFGCGCGKCTFFSFIERGCPTPIPSASSFPYLDLSGLTHEQQQELRGRLRFESQDIMIRFQELVSATIKSFQRRCIPLDDLVSHVMTLGAFDPVFKEPQVPLFQYCFQELKAADTIPKVFLVLKDYFSFFNYHIIEHIIKELGTEEDKAELQRYKADFDQYAKRRIFECLPEFGPVSDADHADIFVKLDSQYGNYTVAQIEGFRHKLSDILRVSSQNILRLCRVEKGCFLLIFQVPSFVQLRLFPLSREQESGLAAIGVFRLTCGEYHFLNDKLPQGGVEKKYQHHPDDDSGVGPSIFTDTKSTTFSEDCLDKELKEVDYELRVQDLLKTAFSHESESGLELHHAVAMGDLEYVRLLIEKHCDPMQRDENAFTTFHVVAIVGNVKVLKYFITECNCNPACPGPLGLTPLHLASHQGHVDVVKYLVIEQQIDPLCEDEYGNTPLHRACAGGCQAVVEFLTSELEKYTPITGLISNLKNKWNRTPLHSAIANGHLGILHYFISDLNCDPNILGQYGGILHYAAQVGHLHIVKYFIDVQGCNPDCLKYTPLHCAAVKGHTDIVKFLTVEKHCNPMCRDSDQYTPLHMAAHNGHLDVVKFLTLEMHCDPTSRNAYNDTALHLAVVNGHLDILRFFVSDQNCDPNIPGQQGKTPLHWAALFGHSNIVKYLIDEQDCNPTCLDDMKCTPIHYAAMKGHMDIVKFLTVRSVS